MKGGDRQKVDLIAMFIFGFVAARVAPIQIALQMNAVVNCVTVINALDTLETAAQFEMPDKALDENINNNKTDRQYTHNTE